MRGQSLIAVVVAVLALGAWSSCGSANGDEGNSAVVAFVAMNADGSVRYAKGVDASDPLTTGKFPDDIGGYQVLFTHDVSKCVAVANVRGPASGVIPPAFAVVGRSSDTQVTVSIFKSDGTPFAAPFELAVFC